MVEGWILWVLGVGLAVGAAGAWLFMVRLARDEDDVSDDERTAEAAWISDAIERQGGIAPETLVEEVLELHQLYLRTPRAAPEEMLPPPAVEPWTPSPPGSAPGAAPAAGRSGDGQVSWPRSATAPSRPGTLAPPPRPATPAPPPSRVPGPPPGASVPPPGAPVPPPGGAAPPPRGR